MARWLFKQEPECYSWADLEREGLTAWDGVGNALALKHLRAARAGDRAFFYATGKTKAVVGEMLIVQGGEKVEVAPAGALARPVTLAEIKAEPSLAECELVRLPRLSVMPVSLEAWRQVLRMSKRKEE